MLQLDILHDAHNSLIDLIVETLQQFLPDTLDNAFDMRVARVVLFLAFVAVVGGRAFQLPRAAAANLLGEDFVHDGLSCGGG